MKNFDWDFEKQLLICFSLSFMVLVGSIVGLLGCGGVNPSISGRSNPAQGQVPGDLSSGGISGTVLGSNSNPLENALIETQYVQAITGIDGRYLLAPLPVGDYQVTARATGYAPLIQNGIRVRAGLVTENVDLILLVSSASASKDFSVRLLQPAFGTDQDEISVVGTGFGAIPGRVTVNGKDASILIWNDGLIKIWLPSEVETGPVRVFIGSEGSHESQPVIFTAKPVALEVQPKSGKPGEIVTIVGRNFHPIPNYNLVTLNGTPVQVLPDSSTTRLKVIVPSNAQTGYFEVKIQGDAYQLDGISYALLTIPPELIHLSPKRSIPDVTLYLYGRNFGYDSTVVKILLGETITLGYQDFLSFSSTLISFKAPDNTVLAPGDSVNIYVTVNDIKTSNYMTYTAYNNALTTIPTYGIYDFSSVSTNNTLHLPSLSLTDRFALVTILSGDGSSDIGGNFSYNLTSILGGNIAQVPTLPSYSVKPLKQKIAKFKPHYFDPGPLIRSWAKKQPDKWQQKSIYPHEGVYAPEKPGMAHLFGGYPQIRAMTNPAPASTTFWMIDWLSSNPDDSANDVIASATLQATGVHCLVYLDIASDTVVPPAETGAIASIFDGIYETLATACWDGISNPPEGNIDAQPRVVIFVTPQLNRGSTSSNVILGYFNPRDKIPAQTHSAGTEILYLYDRTYSTSIDDFKGVIAHELQHLIYYNQKGAQGVVWLDEGLSVFAQQVVGYGFQQGMSAPVSQVAEYLDYPQMVSLNHWDTQSTLGNYGMSYLFVQYLYERCGGFNAIRIMERSNGTIGFTDLDNNLIKPFAIPPSSGLEAFFNEFGIAMYADELQLSATLPGYKPDEFKFRDIGLRNTFSGVNGMRHLTFDENPVMARTLSILGYGCDVVEYYGGNGGDLEITLNSTPTPPGGSLKAFVLYYPGE